MEYKYKKCVQLLNNVVEYLVLNLYKDEMVLY